MEFLEAKKIMEQKMGDWKIMALASCEDNYPMVRNVSCLFYNDKIYFKTDKNFRKTQQLFKNNRVAMCFNGTQVEGIAANKGLVVDEPGRLSFHIYILALQKKKSNHMISLIVRFIFNCFLFKINKQLKSLSIFIFIPNFNKLRSHFY